MNTQSPPTTLSEERLKEIQVLRDARLYPDNWNEAHNIAEATRYSLADCEYAFALHNAFPSLLHAAEQMAKLQTENKVLQDALKYIKKRNGHRGDWPDDETYLSWLDDKIDEVFLRCPPAPEKGGQGA